MQNNFTLSKMLTPSLWSTSKKNVPDNVPLTQKKRFFYYYFFFWGKWVWNNEQRCFQVLRGRSTRPAFVLLEWAILTYGIGELPLTASRSRSAVKLIKLRQIKPVCWAAWAGWRRAGCSPAANAGNRAVPASPAPTGVGRNTLLVPVQFKIVPFQLLMIVIYCVAASSDNWALEGRVCFKYSNKILLPNGRIQWNTELILIYLPDGVKDD